MILVLAGTGDGRELAARLAAAGIELLVSAATAVGEELLRGSGVAVRHGPLDEASLKDLIIQKGILGIVDATHPFALEISRTAARVADTCGIPYLRWERSPAPLPSDPLVHCVPGWEEAAERIISLGVESVFLAVGVKPLEFFLKHPGLKRCRFTVRVLPTAESVEACRRLGLGIDRIIAMQGPGTLELNRALLEASRAEALVTKDSGIEGGTVVKVEAALSLKIPAVVVRRPVLQLTGGVARSVEEVLRWAEDLEHAKECSQC